jgi:hypothetical protein
MKLTWYRGAVLAVPGALLLARGVISDPDVAWVGPLVAMATVGGGLVLAEFDRRWSGLGAAPLLLAITAAGIYGTVPDTEEALALLGAALPLVLLGWPLTFASLGMGGPMPWPVS